MPHHCSSCACIGGAGFSLPTPACGRIFSRLLTVAAPIGLLRLPSEPRPGYPLGRERSSRPLLLLREEGGDLGGAGGFLGLAEADALQRLVVIVRAAGELLGALLEEP